MMTLSTIAILLGAAILVNSLVLIAAPVWAQRVWLSFSRNRPAGWILAAIGLAWASWLLWRMPLGRFDAFKSALFIVTPIVYALVVFCMDELLAARALGGLLVMIPAPILVAAQGHPSSLRLVIVVLAYAIAVKGLALVLSPYLLRKWTPVLLASPACCRAWGAIGVAMSGVLFALAMLVY